MLPFVRLGPFLLQLPGLALLAGVWFGSSLAEREAAWLNGRLGSPISIEALNKLIFYSLGAGIVGARLAYAARFPSVYLESPLSLLALTPATLWPAAGLVAGLAAAAITIWLARLPLRPALDALAPGLALFMVGLGLAHALSGDAFGAPAVRPDGSGPLPWAIYLWDAYRHPTQIYETLAALAVLWAARRRPLGRPGNGLNFLLVVGLAAAARLWLEAFRGDSLVWPGGWRAAQVGALAVVAASLGLMRGWADDRRDVQKAPND